MDGVNNEWGKDHFLQFLDLVERDVVLLIVNIERLGKVTFLSHFEEHDIVSVKGIKHACVKKEFSSITWQTERQLTHAHEIHSLEVYNIELLVDKNRIELRCKDGQVFIIFEDTKFSDITLKDLSFINDDVVLIDCSVAGIYLCISDKSIEHFRDGRDVLKVPDDLLYVECCVIYLRIPTAVIPQIELVINIGLICILIYTHKV